MVTILFGEGWVFSVGLFCTSNCQYVTEIGVP